MGTKTDILLEILSELQSLREEVAQLHATNRSIQVIPYIPPYQSYPPLTLNPWYPRYSATSGYASTTGGVSTPAGSLTSTVMAYNAPPKINAREEINTAVAKKMVQEIDNAVLSL